MIQKGKRVTDPREIGEVLMELMALPQDQQPSLVIYNKTDNHTVEGIKINHQWSSVVREGRKVILGTMMLGGGRFDYVWYAEGEEPAEGQAEREKLVDWIEVYY